MSLTALGPTRAPEHGAVAMLTGWAVNVPSAGELPPLELGTDDGEALPVSRAHQLLGRKGLLAKESATKLALCAVHRALGLAAGGRPPAIAPDPRTAVVACSNLGNVETAVRVARTVRGSSVRDVSPLDAPNASSNVIASTVAIWFRFGGPNLMVCSGATAGLDALRLASLLFRAGRADRVVVVGAEPDDKVACAVLRGRRAAQTGGSSARLRAGAAAFVLEPVRTQPAHGDGPSVEIGPIRVTPPGAGAPGLTHGFCLGPSGMCAWPVASLDLERVAGLYGALGVVQVAVAAELALDRTRRPGGPVTVVCGDEEDGWRSTTVAAGQLL